MNRLTRRVTVGALFLGLVCLWVGGCGNKSSDGISTAIRVNVFLAEEDVYLDGELHRLEFHVAVRAPGGNTSLMFDHQATGTVAEVAGRMLVSDPFRLLIRENGDSVMEIVKVYVMAFQGQEYKAWGTFYDPDEQPFFSGRVVDRTIILYARERVPPPFEMGETGCFYDHETGMLIPSPHDRDCDGAVAKDDCDDLDPNVRPGATEICYNGVDDDCDGVTDEVQDEDNDLYSNCDGDCDDFNENINPGAVEICDGLDNNCDGFCDDTFDNDGDGYTACTDGLGTFIMAGGLCEGPPSAEKWDCNDQLEGVHPYAAEACDGVDNNCDGFCDEGFDNDGDGWNQCGTWRGLDGAGTCRSKELWAEDCEDSNENIYPTAVEICDGGDTNCSPGDELGDTSQPCYNWYNSGQDVWCSLGARWCQDFGGLGWAACEVGPDPGNATWDIYCEVYADCLLTDPEDPFTCTDNKITEDAINCHVHNHYQTGPCDVPSLVVLPVDPNATTCFWEILDAGNTTDWSVQLYEWDGWNYVPSGATASTCQAAVGADPTGSVNVSSTITLLLTVDGGASYVVLDVSVNSMMVSNCPADGVQCGTGP